MDSIEREKVKGTKSVSIIGKVMHINTHADTHTLVFIYTY